MEGTTRKIALGVGVAMWAVSVTGMVVGALLLMARATDNLQHGERYTTTPEPLSPPPAYHSLYPQLKRKPILLGDNDDDVEDSRSDGEGKSVDSEQENTAEDLSQARSKPTSSRRARHGGAATTSRRPTRASLTDCSHFAVGRCRNGHACRYRHSPTVTANTPACQRWPKCTELQCRFRHSKAALPQRDTTTPKPRLANAPDGRAPARSVPVPVTVPPPRAVVAARPSAVSAPLSSPGAERHVRNAAAGRNLKAAAHRSYNWAAIAQTDTDEESECKEPVHAASAVHCDESWKAESAIAFTVNDAVSNAEDALQCPQCVMRTRTAKSLIQHQTAKRHWRMCPAEDCQHEFVTAQQLSDHSRLHRPSHAEESGATKRANGEWMGTEDLAEAVWWCFDCGHGVATKAAMYQHREVYH